MDVTTYEQFEKKSYAQVVANGERRMAGWRISKPIGICRGKGETDGQVSRAINPEFDNTIIVSLDHQCLASDSRHPTSSKAVGQQTEFHRPFGVGSRSASNHSGTANSQGSKVAKILHGIIPRQVNDFRVSPVHSTESQHAVGAVKNKAEEHEFHGNRSKFGKTNFRRNYPKKTGY